MKRMLALVLLVGAVLSLMGQQSAAAATPPAATDTTSGSTMSSDCMEMMGGHKSDPARKPVNGISLSCIFAMGCAVPLMRDPMTPIAPVAMVMPPPYWTTTKVLAGSDTPPEIHPPTTFA